MLKDIAEVISKLWTSWSLLIGTTLVFGLLWLVSSSSILNNEVLQVFNKYRGYIGFAALVLVLVTSARIMIALVVAASHKISDLNKRRPRLKAIEERQKTVLRRIPYLEKTNRELLKSLIDKKQQQFTLPHNGNDYSWVGAYADVVMADMGIPYTEYKSNRGVWKYLNSNLSVLEVEEQGENKSEPQA